MRVNVKFNDFTVRKLKPNIFENYQLIETATQSAKEQSTNHQSASDEPVEEPVQETVPEVPEKQAPQAEFESPSHHQEDEKMEDSENENDDENRLCEWAGCNQYHQGLQGLVQHVNSTHVQVK